MMCIATLVIIWSAHTRISEHNTYHQNASYITTQKTANEIAYYLQEQKRHVKLFANSNSSKLWHTLENPDDEKAFHLIYKNLKQHLPDAFTFTVTSQRGEIKHIDFDNLIGQKCIDDIQSFIKTGKQDLRIHPAEIYHFDIITQFEHNDKQGIFFVSFKTDSISRTLAQTEIPGHQLLLTLEKENHLIEVTSKGNRNIWNRDNYKLNQSELNRMFSISDVNQTNWQVVDIENDKLFSEYKTLIYTQSNLVIAILAISALLFMVLNHREIRRRQKAEIVKDEFLSIVSHELRTPLTAIKGAITLINNGITGKINEKTKSIISIADNNTQRLTALVNDLLDVQKLESGKMKYKRKLVKPITFIENAVSSIQNSYCPAPWKINISNQLNQEMVFADSSRMEQVFVNILSNAVKYGSKKDNIDISMLRKNESIIISITDYGTGIREETKNQIFEKFTQSKMTDNRHESGSGLGLYIARIITEYHGGKITYISTPGKGTTFYVQLPIIIIKRQAD